MGFSHVLSELMRRYKVTANELALKTGHSRPHLSNVAEGHQPGSLKLIGDCIKAVGLDPELCITLPLDPSTADEDTAVLAIFKKAIDNGGDDRERVHEQADVLRKRMEARLSLKKKKGVGGVSRKTAVPHKRGRVG